MRKLNELEGAVLGIIHKRQPCTAYSVRVELKASPSSRWRASAGSIYPLLDRLEGEALIVSQEDADDRRGRKLLSVTAHGRKAFKAWIRDIASPEVISDVYDPLRTRIFFLDALSDKERQQFAEEVLQALLDHVANAKDYLEERPASEDVFGHLGALGGVMNAECRLALIEKVQARINRSR